MNTISAWDIYWVMQLDSINLLMTIILFFAGGFCICLWFSATMDADCSKIHPESAISKQQASDAVTKFSAAKRIATFALPLALIVAFLPSSKTAAAMYVIPAIANNETLRSEAGDLYKLAKEALKQAVGSEEKRQ